MAFSARILTLAIALDSSASCPLNFPPVKNDGIVKKQFLCAKRSRAV